MNDITHKLNFMNMRIWEMNKNVFQNRSPNDDCLMIRLKTSDPQTPKLLHEMAAVIPRFAHLMKLKSDWVKDMFVPIQGNTAKKTNTFIKEFITIDIVNIPCVTTPLDPTTNPAKTYIEDETEDLLEDDDEEEEKEIFEKCIRIFHHKNARDTVVPHTIETYIAKLDDLDTDTTAAIYDFAVMQKKLWSSPSPKCEGGVWHYAVFTMYWAWENMKKYSTRRDTVDKGNA